MCRFDFVPALGEHELHGNSPLTPFLVPKYWMGSIENTFGIMIYFVELKWLVLGANKIPPSYPTLYWFFVNISAYGFCECYKDRRQTRHETIGQLFAKWAHYLIFMRVFLKAFLQRWVSGNKMWSVQYLKWFCFECHPKFWSYAYPAKNCPLDSGHISEIGYHQWWLSVALWFMHADMLCI